jgi:energy-coupling factor transporter ATP-binding protein EcfA2
MNLQIAQRKNAKIKMAIQGPSGSGKTYSSLLLAYGITKDWSKIAVVDTENHSADLYSSLGPYYVLCLSSPFTPEKYIEALQLCERSGIEVLILDSITHSWEYLLDYHSNLPGNSFTAWAKVTPRHNAFVQAILQSPMHIICTIRTKQDYVLVEKNGKQVPEKVGLKSIQRDGLDFEFTLVFDLDIKNNASTSKDRTGLFFGKPEHKITTLTGEMISQWCTSAIEVTAEDLCSRINDAKTIKELIDLYRLYPNHQENLKPKFEQRKLQLTQ